MELAVSHVRQIQAALCSNSLWSFVKACLIFYILLDSKCCSSFTCVGIICPHLAQSLSPQELIDTLSHMTHRPGHRTLYLLNSSKRLTPTTFFVVNNSRTNGCVPYFTIQYSLLWRNTTLIQPFLLTKDSI